MLYMYMSEKTIMENLMELKDKNPKYIYLIVNKEFDDKLREELFWEQKDVRVFLSEVAWMTYVISPFFKETPLAHQWEKPEWEKDEMYPKYRLAQFNAHAVIAQHYVMNNENEDREGECLDDFFILID